MTPILTPLPMSSRERRLRELEEIRSGLPLPQYLLVLHSAAMTGQIPVFKHQDNDPRKPVEFTGEYKPLSPDMQVKVATYLVDKAMPDKPAQETHGPTELLEMAPDPRRMTRDQLLTMLLSATALKAPESA